MIKVYLEKTDFLQTDEVYLEYYKNAKIDRQKKVDACKRKEDKIRSLAAGALLSYALEQEGIKHYDIIYKEAGKPSLKEQTIQFNISHSGQYVLCGISDKDIGVDIQEIKADKEFGKIVRRFFKQEEAEEYFAYDIARQSEVFASFWAMKESYAKCTGKGIAKGLSDISLSLQGQSFRDVMNENFQIIQLEKEGYKIAVCTKQHEEVEWKESKM